MAEKTSYLGQLKFDPKLLNSPIAKYLTNFRFVLLLIIAIFVMGIFSFLQLPRRLNPEVKIPIVIVNAVFPGAGPSDVESLVSVPIEDSLNGIAGVSKISSTSADSVSTTTVEFNSGVDPDKARDDVKSAVDTVNNLPSDVQTPIVQKLDFENQPVWTFLVTTKSDDASLISFSKNLQDKLEKLPSVKKVVISGIEEQEVQVLIKNDAARQYKVDPLTLSRAVQTAVHSQPAGILNTDASSLSLTVDPTVQTVADLRELTVNLGGQVVKLGDVATVISRSKPNQSQAYFANNNSQAQRVVTFSVFKTDSVNIDKAVADARASADGSLKGYESEFGLVSVSDQAKLVNKQFTDLLGSFRDTILLVILVLFIFLGIRQALVVAFCIPLSFLIAFTVMRLQGLTINFLSLFSLLLALGLLVDDAIVIVTAVTAYWRVRKFTPNETGLLVIRDFIVPIWSTTITAVWAFLPLLVASGIIGEFIKSIPIVVSTTLIASTAVAVLITLPLMMILLKPNFPNRVRILLWLIFFTILSALIFLSAKGSMLLPLVVIVWGILMFVGIRVRRELMSELSSKISRKKQLKNILDRTGRAMDSGVFDSQKFAHRYQRLIDNILASGPSRMKVLAMVVIFAVFAYSLAGFGFIKNEFFPKSNENLVYIGVELPQGTNLETSIEESRRLLGEFKNVKGPDYVLSEIGKTISTESFTGNGGNSNNILFTFVLPDKDKRKITSSQFAEQLRSKYEKDYTNGKLSVVELTGGPPAGADLQIKISGDDLGTLDTYANKLVEFLNTESAVTNVSKSIKPGTSKIVFVPDDAAIAQAGLSTDMIANQLRTFANGFTLNKDFRVDGQKQDIVFRTNFEVEDPENLSSISVQSLLGGAYPLSSLGTFKLEVNPTLITREDAKRTISVSGAIRPGNNLAAENKRVEDFAKKLDLPAGYEWKTGGVNDENNKSVTSIMQAMVIAFILIATTMIVQFGSFRKAFIILLLIPLAISGVFVLFALTGTPLSFPTLIGILALFGIVVYQAMMIVDKIGRNQATGMTLKHAISDACASRVEPILFGTITTVAGLIPITLSDPLWRGLGGAIIAGMLFSGIIMLLFVPIVYYQIFKGEVK
ncbi:MAG TPA: efflux RND transporter permease subunit [Candidatus Saccharimonadales bacterium]|nr:efflux RND transporter permease subunit [Candidatus Saccharimonadales bacterium]